MTLTHEMLFKALGDPTRRAIFERLCRDGEQTVGALTAQAGVSQPAVSKHLAVLRAVGLVTVQKVGKSRLYALNPAELKPVHEWLNQFERLWTSQLDRIKQRAEQKAKERAQRN